MSGKKKKKIQCCNATKNRRWPQHRVDQSAEPTAMRIYHGGNFPGRWHFGRPSADQNNGGSSSSSPGTARLECTGNKTPYNGFVADLESCAQEPVAAANTQRQEMVSNGEQLRFSPHMRCYVNLQLSSHSDSQATCTREPKTARSLSTH